MDRQELAAAAFDALDVPAYISAPPPEGGTDDVVVQVNAAFERHTGLPRERTLGAPPPEGFVQTALSPEHVLGTLPPPPQPPAPARAATR